MVETSKNIFTIYKINVCNIKEHVLKYHGAKAKFSPQHRSYFNETYVQKLLQHRKKLLRHHEITTTNHEITTATSRNHYCNITKSQLQHTRGHLLGQALLGIITGSIKKSHRHIARCCKQHASDFFRSPLDDRGIALPKKDKCLTPSHILIS